MCRSEVFIRRQYLRRSGREECYSEVVGKESLHSESNDNGLLVIYFAASKNMIVKSTCIQRKDIKRVTWQSRDGVTCNKN